MHTIAFAACDFAVGSSYKESSNDQLEVRNRSKDAGLACVPDLQVYSSYIEVIVIVILFNRS